MEHLNLILHPSLKNLEDEIKKTFVTVTESPDEAVKAENGDNPQLLGQYEYDGRILPECVHLNDFRVLGWFGRDVDGNYKDDESILKYLHIPPSPNVRYDLTVKHQDDEMGCSGLTFGFWHKWIMENIKDEQGKPTKPTQRFVSLRHVMQHLLCTPYVEEEGWDVEAVKLKDSIYLDFLLETKVNAINEVFAKTGVIAQRNKCTPKVEVNTPVNKNGGQAKAAEEVIKQEQALHDEVYDMVNAAVKNAQNYENAEMFERFGSKFEQYISSSSPHVAPDPTQPLRKYADFNLPMEVTLGHHTLLYTGEMDPLPRKVDLNDLTSAELIEVKTMKQRYNIRSHKRYRLLKWWAQSMLAKCHWVMVGYRDDFRGVVCQLQRIKVESIPRLVDGIWYPSVCFTFLDNMLHFIDSTLNQYPEGTNFRFICRPKIRRNLVLAIVYPQGYDLGIIPTFYKEWLEQF